MLPSPGEPSPPRTTASRSAGTRPPRAGTERPAQPSAASASWGKSGRSPALTRNGGRIPREGSANPITHGREAPDDRRGRRTAPGAAPTTPPGARPDAGDVTAEQKARLSQVLRAARERLRGQERPDRRPRPRRPRGEPPQPGGRRVPRGAAAERRLLNRRSRTAPATRRSASSPAHPPVPGGRVPGPAHAVPPADRPPGRGGAVVPCDSSPTIRCQTRSGGAAGRSAPSAPRADLTTRAVRLSSSRQRGHTAMCRQAPASSSSPVA
ncbi:hypothetical protein SPILM97S_01340 [Streptomyces pilosus]